MHADDEGQRHHRADQRAADGDAPRRPFRAARPLVEPERGSREPSRRPRGREHGGDAEEGAEERAQGAGSVRNPSGIRARMRASAGGRAL
jgi:hypothetical protein